MTEERKTRIHTDNNVVSALASAASAGVTAPSFRLLERLPWDTIAQALGMLSLNEGVQLRTVSKVPGNRLVLPDNKSPLLDSASLSPKQIEAVLSSDKALKTIQQGVWLTTSLTLRGPESTRLLSRLRFHHLQTLDLSWSYGQRSLEPLAKLTQLQTLNLGLYLQGSLEPLASLTQLQTLKLWSYRQGSLEPLAKLTQLQTLDLGSYRQDSLEPLAKLTQLQTLDLGSYGQGSLEPLAKLTQLQTLKLWWYRQGSLEPLAKLTQLQTLYLGLYRQGGSLEPLASLTQLQTLDLWSYREGSLEPLAKLTRLQTLNLTNYADRVAARSFFARVLPTLHVL